MFYIQTLTIAGSDCSGGAGIQADIKTMSALGCYAASVITAVTAQNTCGVRSVKAMSPTMITEQIVAVMEDLQPVAVKVGMVADAAGMGAVASCLRHYRPAFIVVDPVMVATSGDKLMQQDALTVLREELMPLATLPTPNIPEAEVLSGMKIESPEAMRNAGERILQSGCRNLLIKGGHLAGGEITDLLFCEGETTTFNHSAIKTGNTHGTGCTLSSAIAAHLARGCPLKHAVEQAIGYVEHAIEDGADVQTGHGHGPVNHFFCPQPLIKM